MPFEAFHHSAFSQDDRTMIIVLQHGRIVEQGTHQQLLAAHGHYADLYNLQARRYQLS